MMPAPPKRSAGWYLKRLVLAILIAVVVVEALLRIHFFQQDRHGTALELFYESIASWRHTERNR
jgi:hypothetical protein